MSSPVDVLFAQCHVVLSNLNSDGSISIPANNAPVLIATVPLTTGAIPLNVTTLAAQAYLSFDCLTNDGSVIAQWRRNLGQVVHGHPTPASMSFGSNTGMVPVFLYESNSIFSGALANFVETINGSGDLEIAIQGLSSGAKPMTLSNIHIDYRIFGSK
jgi:hypothetical protein